VLSSSRFASVVAASYAVVSAVWIVGSDLAVGFIETGEVHSLPLHTLKGLLFIAVTTAVLFLVVRGQVRRTAIMQAHSERIERLRLLGETAGSIAHDFRNILMSCRVQAEVIGRSQSDERARHAAAQIIAATRRGEEITREILDFAESKPLRRDRVDLREFLDAVADEVRPGLSAEVTIEAVVSPETLAADADVSQLHRVLYNLAVNAKEAIDGAGHIRIEACPAAGSGLAAAELGVANPARFVDIAVSDTGCGIPSDLLQRVFEPRMTTKRSGTGLGLAIVHRIVADHGGQVFAMSEQGKGTTVHVLLPRRDRSGPSSPNIALSTGP
jgi:signal transduction histidine kinase